MRNTISFLLLKSVCLWSFGKIKIFFRALWQTLRQYWQQVLLFIILAALWDIAVKEFFRPAVVVFPQELTFNRSDNVATQIFAVKNRSSEPRFNITLLVVEGDLDRRFEHIDLVPITKPHTSVEDKELLALNLDFQIDCVGESSIGPADDPKTKWIKTQNIAQLKGGETRLFAIKFKSVRKQPPLKRNLTLRIDSQYELVPFLATGKPLPKEKLPYKPIEKTEPRSFDYQGTQITALIDKNKEVWFVASPILKVLQIANEEQAIDALNYDFKSTATLFYNDGSEKKGQFLVNDMGFQRLVIMSPNNPAALQFEKWITNTVLPTMKKQST